MIPRWSRLERVALPDNSIAHLAAIQLSMTFLRVMQKGAPDDDGFPKMGALLFGFEQPSSPQAHQGAKSSTQPGALIGR